MVLTPIVVSVLISTRIWRLCLSFVVMALFFTCQPAFASVKKQAVPDSFKVSVEGKGKPIILIPGLMSDGRIWRGIREHLVLQYQVHTLSFAGFAGMPPAAVNRSRRRRWIDPPAGMHWRGDPAETPLPAPTGGG